MTEKIATTHEEAAKIEELMKAPFPVTLATVAKALNTTELASAQKMPDDAVAFVTGSIAERFGALWAELASWQKVTLFIVHAGHVFEIQTKLSTGKCARGYYNILQKDAVAGGHIKYEDIAAAAFVTMPFMGRESHSVQFFCNDGSVAFSVYVGRENHQLIDSVVEAFHKAKAAFCFGS